MKVINPPQIADIVLRCVSSFELKDREGRVGRGFTNLKRILGRPADFACVVDQLAQTVPVGHAVAACDEGAWALVGAVALRLKVPAILVRRNSKTYFVSYGDDPTIGDGRLVGERQPPGTPIHMIDDLVFSGNTLRSARAALHRVGLDSKTASAILWTYRADAAREELATAGLTAITCLVSQDLVPA
ncbi:MAG TPA: hypothetical protein VKY65_17385 [Alphaproteobacteria bacterium]|nr:hypothetical protein [Alphaproteobacteria bacterium]